MRQRFFVVLVLFCLVSLAQVQAASPPPPIMAAIRGLITATNAGGASNVGSYFANNAIVVDNFAPYTWAAPSAGQRWWRDLEASLGGGTIHLTAGTISQYSSSGPDAYAVVPLHVVSVVKDKTTDEDGLWVLTLHRLGATWKITSASWATTRST